MTGKITNAVLPITLSALFMLAVIGFSGCISPKETITYIDRVEVDSTSVKQRDSLVRLIVELKDTHIQEIQQLFDGLVIFDNECDTVIIDKNCNVDSALAVVRSLRNKVKILSDGSIEAEGKIKVAKSSSERTDKEAQELSVRYEKLVKVKDSLATELSKSQFKKSKNVNRKSSFLLPLFIIGLIAGAIIEYKFKLFHKFFNLLKK